MDAVNQALENKDYEKAIELATQELKIAPTSSRLFLKRSIANLRLQKPTEALNDAESAVSLATDESLRGEAQLRSAIAFYQLKKFGEAKAAIRYAQKCNCVDKTLAIWLQKIEAETTQQAELVEIPSNAEPVVKPSIRKDWYQIGNKVTVSVFIRDAPSSTKVDISADRIEIPAYDFVLDLSHPIDPSSAKIDIVKPKIELTFEKASPGNWSQLAKTPDDPKPLAKPKAAFEKEWNIDDEPEEESGDPQAFFEKIYKDADPDAQRAMMKSFIESNGTTLSTNWAEVSKGKVEITPPSGMEAKKWT